MISEPSLQASTTSPPHDEDRFSDKLSTTPTSTNSSSPSPSPGVGVNHSKVQVTVDPRTVTVVRTFITKI